MAERTGGGNILTVSPFNIKTLKCVQYLNAAGKFLQALRMVNPKPRKQIVDVSMKLKYT